MYIKCGMFKNKTVYPKFLIAENSLMQINLLLHVLHVKRENFNEQFSRMTSLVVWWSELLTTNHEVQGSIPGSTMGIFLVGGGSPW
jgi:hypothetical protein